MKPKVRKKSIEFTIGDLIHLRRFLNRSVRCCQGECPGYRIYAWYYVGPLMKKIDGAEQSIRSVLQRSKIKKRERPIVLTADDWREIAQSVYENGLANNLAAKGCRFILKHIGRHGEIAARCGVVPTGGER